MDYWKECISEAFDDAGIAATDEQIGKVADWVEGAHENYGMAHGHDHIPNPLIEENKVLEEKLKREKDKVICRECNGRGYQRTPGPIHTAESPCMRCNGRGTHDP